MIINKAFLTVMENKGINGFPFAMQEFGNYFASTATNETVKDRVKVGDYFKYREDSVLDGLCSNKFAFYDICKTTFKDTPLGVGGESQFKGFIRKDDKIYAWTNGGIAIADANNIYRWVWTKNGLTSLNIIKLIYDLGLKIFIAITSNDILYSTEECTEFKPFATGSGVISKTITDISSVKNSSEESEIVVTTKDGIFYTKIPLTQDLTNFIPTWTACPKKVTESVSISSYPETTGILNSESVIKKVASTSPLSDKVNAVEYDKQNSRWVFASENGVFFSSDLSTFGHITDQQNPDFSGYSAPPPPAEGEEPAELPVANIVLSEWHNSTKLINMENIIYFIADCTIDNTFNGIHKITSPTSEIPIVTDNTDIADCNLVHGTYVILFKDNTLSYSFDKMNTFYKRTPGHGYSSKILSIFKTDDRIIFGSNKGIIESIEKDVKMIFLPVNRDPKTKKTTAELSKESDLIDFTLALHDVSKAENPVIKGAIYLQNRIADYVFVLVTDSKTFRNWYLFGKEERYNEMKEVAKEFGVEVSK